MRIHLQLLDETGVCLTDTSCELSEITISASTLSDLQHPALRSCERIRITTDGYHATFQQGERTHPLQRKNIVEIGANLKLQIDLYPRPDAVPKQKNICPSCGDKLQDEEVGGAYRSIAREQLRCDTCQTEVLTIYDAPETLGHFSDLTSDDFIQVLAGPRCPQCLQSMLRSTLRSQFGEAEVERCPRCLLVVIEPKDKKILLGNRRIQS